MTELVLDEQTTKVLTNFSKINDQIVFRPGPLTTVSPGRKLVGVAETNLNVDRPFGIDKLSQLLNAIGLFSSPQIILGDNALSIRDGQRMVNYTYTDPENVLSWPPDKEFEMNSDVTFALKANVLKDIQKAAGILNSLQDVGFEGDGKTITAKVFNNGNPTSNIYTEVLGQTDKKFKVYQKVTFLHRLLQSDYEVHLDLKKNICRFESNGMKYWMALEV